MEELNLAARVRSVLSKIWHGEMAAIANLSALVYPKPLSSLRPETLELYTTAEPCSMCMSAVIWSGFGRVVFGSSIPFLANRGHLSQISIRAQAVADAAAPANDRCRCYFEENTSRVLKRPPCSGRSVR